MTTYAETGAFFRMQAWIEHHRPDLHARLADVQTDDVPAILNEETGLSFTTADSMHQSAVAYLQALKQPSKQTPAGMMKVRSAR